jgi:hypothetical protein
LFSFRADVSNNIELKYLLIIITKTNRAFELRSYVPSTYYSHGTLSTKNRVIIMHECVYGTILRSCLDAILNGVFKGWNLLSIKRGKGFPNLLIQSYRERNKLS